MEVLFFLAGAALIVFGIARSFTVRTEEGVKQRKKQLKKLSGQLAQARVLMPDLNEDVRAQALVIFERALQYREEAATLLIENCDSPQLGKAATLIEQLTMDTDYLTDLTSYGCMVYSLPPADKK